MRHALAHHVDDTVDECNDGFSSRQVVAPESHNVAGAALDLDVGIGRN